MYNTSKLTVLSIILACHRE